MLDETLELVKGVFQVRMVSKERETVRRFEPVLMSVWPRFWAIELVRSFRERACSSAQF